MYRQISKSAELDKEAIVVTAAVLGTALSAALTAYFGYQGAKNLITKSIPGAVNSVARGEWKKAGGHALRGALDVAFMYPVLGTAKVVKGLPNLYRAKSLLAKNPALKKAIASQMSYMAKARETAYAAKMAAAGGKAATARQMARAGKGVTQQSAVSQLMRQQGQMAMPRNMRSVGADLGKLDALQRSTRLFNAKYDSRVMNKIPGMRRWNNSTPGKAMRKARYAFPAIMGTSVLAEKMAPTEGGMPQSMARGAATPYSWSAYGPGGKGLPRDAAMAAFYSGLGYTGGATEPAQITGP